MLETPKKKNSFDICKLLVDASIDRVMAMDTEWRIIAWNRTSEIITGLQRSELLNRNLLDVFPYLENDDESIEAMRQALNGQKSFLFPNPDFPHRSFYETHFIPLEDDNGILIGVMNLMHDVSHRIKAEHELQRLNTALKSQYDQLEKTNAELAIFTSITSKDLKEPLRKLYTGLEMVVKADGSKMSDNSKGGLRRMQASLTKMSLMLDDVLALSSSLSFNEKFGFVELDMVLKQVLESLHSKITEKKALVESKPLPVYHGSVEMLYYLFYNLIDNALKFQDHGNTPWIKINAEVITSPVKNVGDDSASFLCLSFRDNGIGFPPEDSKRMFKMFERLHSRKLYSGSGIGLTISRKIVESHDGYIETENQPGGGSIFKCYLKIR